MAFVLQESNGSVADCLESAIATVTLLFSQRGSSAAIISALLDTLGDVLVRIFTQSESSSIFTSANMTKVCDPT